jgi:hypothetical protein
MKGLWSVSTYLQGKSFDDTYAVGRISIDIVFFLVIVFAWNRQPRPTKFESSFDGIGYGTICLLVFVQVPSQIWLPFVLTNS